MSRNFVPALLAIGVGVFTGYYTFQPTFQQLQYEKEHAQKTSPLSDTLAPKQDTGVAANAKSHQDPKSTTQ
ncbi:uncharacterized protein N7515_005454 [Penicillium bovifimosum]|uniref:Uncharacterized protein n=1 Tax=Penicillium bovifimosum TaxID=126998 RepID=A0A9W9GSU8_9EURO|nr:uncharacterized protein N7515_005454 [Penicillium bovifimosum]KAJ5129415.1 hypothetical protein N7515_005454 [Penicillium bovifimosum]